MAQFRISTHTPLAGRDWAEISKWKRNNISTHTPLAGRDIHPSYIPRLSITFLLTRPSRGAT